MFKVLFFLFVVIPIIEIAVLMQVGAILGAWPTIAIVIITAWLGAKNVKQQGIATVQSLQAKMAQGEMPSDDIVAGLLLLVAGVLLVTPGFVTDAFGLSLLVPQIRQWLIAGVKRHLVVTNANSMQGFSFHHQFNHQEDQQQPYDNANFSEQNKQNPRTPHQGETIEGEYERKD